MRKTRVIGRWLALLVGGWVLLHLLRTTLDGLTDDVRPADCLVVLGNTVHSDGSLSERLRARLDKTQELYGQRISPLIFVSGGLGKEGHYEGTAMQRYLVAHGVPAAAIVVDNAGDNTLATARNFRRLAQGRHLRSAVVVSQFFHLSRTKLMLRQQAVPTVYGAHATYYEARDVYALVREFFAYYAYLLGKG